MELRGLVFAASLVALSLTAVGCDPAPKNITSNLAETALATQDIKPSVQTEQKPLPEPVKSALASVGVTAECPSPKVKNWPETYLVPTTGARSAALWDKLRTELKDTGYWPVILGENDDFRLRVELLSDDLPPVQDSIKKAVSLDLAAALKQRWEDALPIAEGVDPEADKEDRVPYELDPAQIKVPDLASDEITTVFGQSDVKSTVWIGIIKTDQPWHLPILFHFGGWNDCPDSEFLAAYLKSLQDTYGAVPMTMTSDTMEIVLPHAPTDRKTISKIVKDAFSMAPDIVDQGVGSLKALADVLAANRVIFYWWD